MISALKKHTVIISLTILFSGCRETDTVKNGILHDFSNSLTVGKALETWSAQECTDTEWNSFTTNRDEKIVSFTCKLDVKSIKTNFDNLVTDEESAKAEADYKKAKSEATESMNVSHEDVYSHNAKAITDAALKKIDASYEAENKLADINSRLARKKLSGAQLEILFSISVDDKSFTPSNAGIKYIFEDGKTYLDDIHSRIALLKAYQNQKIKMNVDQNTYKERD